MHDALETILATIEIPADLSPRRRVEPHPDLIASITPTPRQICEAAAVLGWLPGRSEGA